MPPYCTIKRRVTNQNVLDQRYFKEDQILPRRACQAALLFKNCTITPLHVGCLNLLENNKITVSNLVLHPQL